MLNDLDEPGIAGSTHCDLCIVGSGAGGITIAREFIGTQHSVIVLEGGGPVFETDSQDPYKSEVVGLRHAGIHHGRVRTLGGTTTLWPGQTIPFWDVDFQKRDWVPYSGWPIDRSTLLRHYARAAEEVLHVGGSTFELSSLVDQGVAVPETKSTEIVNYISRFCPTPNFSELYRAELSAASNIRLITHANVVSLVAEVDATAVREVVARSLKGHEIRVSAKTFVVCCGGIETARLLLVSNSVEPNGIGNRNGVVGRFFQDHPSVAAAVRPLDVDRFCQWYDAFRVGGMMHHVKFAASESLQREKRILHVGAEVYHPLGFVMTGAKMLAGSVLQGFRKPRKSEATPPAETRQAPAAPSGGITKLGVKRVRWYQSLASVAQRLDQVGRTAFFRRQVLGAVASVGSLKPHVLFGVEQAPNPESRVTLGESVDRLGMRRTVLDWRVTEAEGRSILTFAQVVADEWRRLGLAEFKPDDLQVSGRERGEHGGYMDFSHHMGTTRMGTDPTTSVVDPSCRVHGYRNLYIGSCSVFPTSGFSNPTFTMLALCLRISDEIKKELN